LKARRRRRLSAGLFFGVVATYATVTGLCFAVGYVCGRMLL
jgi:hypothetical protein